MSSTSPSIEQILALLEAAPSRIAEFTSGLTETQLHAAPGPDEWSANEVLAHLRTCADVWGSCIMTILTQNKPTLRAVNPRTWIKSTDYLEQDFQPSLHVFTAQRTELLAVLKPLKPKDWIRSATVTGAGKTLQRTVYSYAEWIAVHERPHVKQIRHIAGTVR